MPRFQPPMDIHPASVSIGSVILNLNRPDKPLSTFTPVMHEWTESTDSSRVNKSHSHDGFNDATLQADTLLFATTAKNVTGQLPPTGQGSPRVSFSAGEITARCFVPSANYVRAAVADHEVSKFFEAGGSQARAYLIVGIKVARDMTVVGRDPVEGGPRGGMAGFYQRAEYPGPVLFGVEVEEIRLAQDGGIVRKDLDTLEEAMLAPVHGNGDTRDAKTSSALAVIVPTDPGKVDGTALRVLLPLFWAAASQQRKPVARRLLEHSPTGCGRIEVGCRRAAAPVDPSLQAPLVWAALGDIPPPGHGMTISQSDKDTTPNLIARYKGQTWTNKADGYLEEWNKGTAKRPFRVLVVDTGIDLDSPYITLDAERVKFVRGGAWENKDYDGGHGTHIAHLLLRLSQNITLYVHKIAESRNEMGLSAERIEDLCQVIRELADQDELDVLNLSFGFPSADDPKLQPLRNTLRHIHAVNNVVIVAAAGNNAGLGGALWPASDRSMVIAVGACDGDGNPSPSNPTHPEPRLCTLGEGLQIRLTPDQLEWARTNRKGHAMPKRDRIEAGSSFATAIMAGIVVTVLDYVNRTADEVKLRPWQVQRLKTLRSRNGMVQVLRERCAEKTGATRGGYHHIAPWFLSLDPTGIYGIIDSLGRAGGY